MPSPVRLFGGLFLVLSLWGSVQYTESELSAIRREMTELDILVRNLQSFSIMGYEREYRPVLDALTVWQIRQHPRLSVYLPAVQEKWKRAGVLKHMTAIHTIAEKTRKAIGRNTTDYQRIDKAISQITEQCRSCHIALGVSQPRFE